MQRDVQTALDAAFAYFRPSVHSRDDASISLTVGKMREHLAAIEAELALRANTDPSLERVEAWCFDMSAAPRDGSKVDLLYPYPRGRTIDCFWGDSELHGAPAWIWRKPTWRTVSPGGLLPEKQWNVGCYPNMQPIAWRHPDVPDYAESLHPSVYRRLEMLRDGPRPYGAGCSLNRTLEKLGLAERTGRSDGRGRPEWTITEAGRRALPVPNEGAERC